jgi:uncharacterized NAD-dependent epimerase/dehydratase family protein
MVEPRENLVAHCAKHGIDMEVWRGTELPQSRANASPRSPRLGIAATGPCVGKLTTALFLQRELVRDGVAVGSIATEEAGALLCDIALTNRWVDIRAQVPAAVAALDGADLIISAGQGGLLDGGLPLSNSPWTVNYPLHHFHAFRPHEVLLVVKPSDPVGKIRDAIAMIELMSRGRPPLAIVIPEHEEVAFQQYRRRSPAALRWCRDRLVKRFGIPAFAVFSDGAGARELARHVQRSIHGARARVPTLQARRDAPRHRRARSAPEG